MSWIREHPLLFALSLALLVAGPGLSLPLVLDDWFHLSAIEAWLGGSGPRMPAYFEGWRDPWGGPNVFHFFDGAGTNPREIEAGLVPWWTLPELRIIFLRPLSSLLHVGDVLLFGQTSLGPNLHSLAWYGGLVGVVHLLYRRTLSGPTALVALALFAIDETHWFPTCWIANRNALVAAVPGLLGLLAHLRWQEGWRWGLPLSMLGLGVALAGGEAALSVFGVLAAWQLIAAPGTWRDRALGLLPALALALAWALLYTALEYGAHGSGLYIDPVGELSLFLAAAPARALVLIGGQLAGLPADLYFFAPAAQAGLFIGGLVSLLGFFALLRWLWPELDPRDRRALGWMLPGGLLALLPGLATMPMSRMLLLPGVVWMPAVAIVLRALWLRSRPLALALALPHVVGSTLAWWVLSGATLYIERAYAGAWERRPVGMEEQSALVFTTDPGLGIYLCVERLARGERPPRHWLLASMARAEHEVSRPAADQLQIQVLGGRLGDQPFEKLFRNFEAHPLEQDYEVQVAGLLLHVDEVDRGHPVRWTLQGDLEDLMLLHWDGQDFVRHALPEPGDRRVLEPRPGLMTP